MFGGALSLLGAGQTLHPRLGSGIESTRVQWQAVEGFTRDRLEVLGEDFATDELLPSVEADAKRLIGEAKRAGRELVLLAETIDAIARPFGRALGFNHVIANQLVFANDRATGELLAPIVGPELDPRRLNALAEELGVSLSASAAYGATGADRLLLGAVGSPCGLHADPELARLCRDLDWPKVGAQRSGIAAVIAQLQEGS
jgi:phosphoserine phosphatase